MISRLFYFCIVDCCAWILVLAPAFGAAEATSNVFGMTPLSNHTNIIVSAPPLSGMQNAAKFDSIKLLPPLISAGPKWRLMPFNVSTSGGLTFVCPFLSANEMYVGQTKTNLSSDIALECAEFMKKPSIAEENILLAAEITDVELMVEWRCSMKNVLSNAVVSSSDFLFGGVFTNISLKSNVDDDCKLLCTGICNRSLAPVTISSNMWLSVSRSPVLKSVSERHVYLDRFQCGKLRAYRQQNDISLSMRMPSALTANYLEDWTFSMIYASLTDGTEPSRNSRWRQYLVRMLKGKWPKADLDKTFQLFLMSFPGYNNEKRIEAALAWLEGAGIYDNASGDVYRALTRYYISNGEYDKAIASADKMIASKPVFFIKGTSLKAHAYAFAGNYENAMRCIAQNELQLLDDYEQQRMCFLKAWIFFQEGKLDDALPLLRQLVSKRPKSEFSARAESIISSMNIGM